MTDNALKIFSGNATPALASSICEYLDLELGLADVRAFSDGETNVELGENVRITTDTIPLRPDALGSDKIVVTTISHLLGESIRRIHNEESVSSLFI